MSLIVLAVMAVPVVGADHAQIFTNDEGETSTLIFEHAGDNAYWVEVVIRSHHGTVTGVMARVEGTSTWHSLRGIAGGDGWSKYAPRESFYVPPGKRVQFQAGVAHSTGTTAMYSCFFTHPAGAEQCGAEEPPMTGTFRSPSGNDWWQQVYVDSNKNVQAVSVAFFDTKGHFGHPLTKRSWGAWAGSYNAPHGTLVRFSASDGLAQVSSGCYRWVDAMPMECPNAVTGFNHKGGNEWWVEVHAGPILPQRVQARDDGGEWRELTLRDWGNWAGSFHIEPGHQVEFRSLLQNPMDPDGWYGGCTFTHPQGVTPPQMRMCWAEPEPVVVTD